MGQESKIGQRITIIIPMRNEEHYVAECLRSVLTQLSDERDAEVLCVDGRSDDRTREIVESIAAQDPRVRLLDNPDRIVPTAMNIGINAAQGEVIVRLDCHCRYAPDYIDSCLEVLNRTGADNVGGFVTTVPANDTAAGRAIAAASSSRFGVGGSVFRTGGGEAEVDTVPFGCFRRDVFERFGLYDERLTRNQDIELNSRIRRGGGRIVISPTIKLDYFTRSTFSGFRQQAFYNGLWNPYTLYVTGGSLRLRHFVPLGFVASIIVLGVAGLWFWPAWAVLGLELAAYLSVAGATALQLAKPARTNPAYIVTAFCCLHFAYGVGSLIGVVTAPVKFGSRRSATAGKVLPDRRE